ncbi:MAG: ParA family protein [Myxococcota bacterium]|nr:ParA family protein [Myxococcota bacterium]MDW8363036.1 ParA family protein [Myxococcales bacterium]
MVEATASGATCSVCGRRFEIRFRYQVREEEGRFLHFCSQTCHQRARVDDERADCSVCGRRFVLEGAYQIVTDDRGRWYFCSMACRAHLAQARGRAGWTGVRRVAVFNHKGGTGKTTTAINLAAGLAEAGRRVLLVDADAQGNVGASLGIRGERTLYHVLVTGTPAADAVVPVRPGLDVLTSNETLAAAELALASMPGRERVLRERLSERVHGYDVVVLDCAPALSLLNQNALVYADAVLVPVGCDYLSLVGVRQVLRTIGHVRRLLRHELSLLGVLPTFFDARNRIAHEALQTLRRHFGDRCLPPIRVNTRLREAPSARRTIFEHAPDSHGAEDYRRLVEHVLTHVASGTPDAVAPIASRHDEAVNGVPATA